MIDREKIFGLLSEINDPEVPVINIVEMGIVRDLKEEGSTLVVDITPTYSGCPALKEIETLIIKKLANSGFEPVVRVSFLETWTTDWMTGEAKEKLKNYGIAPPGSVDDSLVFFPKKESSVPCPFCDSKETKKRSEFGSTACKAFYYCNNCQQPFEHFKPI